MAFARMGDGDRAAKILRILNPIEHARSPEEVRRYVVEPYVVPADVYRLPGKIGRGGWTWYTGSASWMYRIWIEEILGFKLEGSSLRIEPVLPHDWEGFRLQFKFGEAVYDISVDNVTSGIKMVEVDGKVIEGGVIQLEKRPIKHRVKVTVGHE
jgi:cyclic beta-1,2-glucan synthetase